MYVDGIVDTDYVHVLWTGVPLDPGEALLSIKMLSIEDSAILRGLSLCKSPISGRPLGHAVASSCLSAAARDTRHSADLADCESYRLERHV